MEPTASDLTISELQKMFARIYANVLQHYTEEGLLLRLGEEVGKIMEIARKDNRHDCDELPRQIGKLFSWWFLAGTKLRIDLQDALWNKYPRVCPWCLRDESCSCGAEHPDIPNREALLRGRRLVRANEPKPLWSIRNCRENFMAGNVKEVCRSNLPRTLRKKQVN